MISALLLLGVAFAKLDKSHKECPKIRPKGDYVGLANKAMQKLNRKRCNPLTQDEITCYFGRHCCCGECFSATSFTCMNGEWQGMYIDACDIGNDCGDDDVPDDVDGQRYKIVKSKHCAKSDRISREKKGKQRVMKFKKKMEALKACNADATCQAVMDYGCNGKRFMLCSSMSYKESKKSCVRERMT